MMVRRKQQVEEEQPTRQVATPDLHQIMAGDQIIYEGENWAQAFLEAGRHPAYREQEIVHLTNGKLGARLGPVLIPRWSEQKTHC
jgi:hypothetical protein